MRRALLWTFFAPVVLLLFLVFWWSWGNVVHAAVHAGIAWLVVEAAARVSFVLAHRGLPFSRPLQRGATMGKITLVAAVVTAAAAAKDKVTVDLGYAKVDVTPRDQSAAAGEAVSLSIRSELMQLLPKAHNTNSSLVTLPAKYLEDVYLGLTTSHLVGLPDGREVNVRTVSGDGGARFEPGEEVRIGWKFEDARLHVS